MTRILGIDYGTRRIGVAMSDEARIIATPLEVLDGREPARPAEAVARLCRTHAVGRVVVGRPLNMNGTAGPSAHGAEAFADALRRRMPSLEVVMWDERLSTREAERVLVEADLSRARRKDVVDKLAAQLILQSYLDAQAGPPAFPR